MSNFSRLTPPTITILVIFIGGLFFIAFYSIYVRHCTNSSGPDNVVPRPRSRRASVGGLDPAVIETFPTFSYSEVKDHKIGKGALECAVCLNEFEDDETLRLIPKCDHVFHSECVDPWLISHVTCPVCRANLVPKPDDKPVIIWVTTNNNDNVIVERNGSRNGEVVVQVDDNERSQEPKVKRNLSFDYLNQLQKSRSMKMFGSDKFRSRSTGHTLVHQGENLERYTLRLPPQVRKEVMHRATSSRDKSWTIALPIEECSRKGYRGDESTKDGKFYEKIEQWSNRRAKSDSRNIFTRAFSMKSPKMGVETDQESTSKGNVSRTLVKMSSFNCLEPKAADEVGLFSDDQLVKLV